MKQFLKILAIVLLILSFCLVANTVAKDEGADVQTGSECELRSRKD